MILSNPTDGNGLNAAAPDGLTVIAAQPGTAVHIPGGHWFLSADFVRQGPDLLLVGDHGEVVLIKGYFALPVPPDLIGGDGATLSGELTVRLAGPAAPGEVAQAGPAAGTEPIGRVETADGTVTVRHADGTEVTLHKGDPVYQGDVLETGPNGAVGLVFADDTTFSLAEGGRLTLDEMVYDPGSGTGAFHASLVQGVFSFVSGEISKTSPEAMVLVTPFANIGIRGTTGAINLPAGETLTVVLTTDPGGTVGEITVFNDAGVQVLNQPFQATQVAGLNLPPSTTFTMTAEEFNDSFGRVMAALPPPPAGGTNGAGEGEGEGGSGTTDGTDAGNGEGEGEGAGGDVVEGGTDQGGPIDLGQAFDQAFATLFGGAGNDLLAGMAPPDFAQVLQGLVGDNLQNLQFFSAYNPFANPEDTGVLVTDFQEVLTATTGNDTLVGGPANTNFVMAQALDNTDIPSGGLGGTDTVDGGDGTDQITFDQLHDVSGYLCAESSCLTLWSWSADGDSDPECPVYLNSVAEPSQATVTFSNMEQLYFGSYDGSADAAFPISFSFGASFIGAVVAGGTGDDNINWNGSADLGWFSGADAVLIFGGGGNDTLHGSSVADDLQGGDGDDVLYGSGGTNSLSGGAGNDTIYVEGTGNTVKGDAGDDIIEVMGATSANTIDGGTEDSGGDTLTYANLGTAVNATFSDSSVGVSHGTGGADVSEIENFIGSGEADILSLSGNASSSGVLVINGGGGADTFNVAAGATYSGKLVGGDGADTINLSSSGSYTVHYAAASEYGDTITGFTGGSGGSILGFDSTIVSGVEGTVFQQLAATGTAGASSGMVAITTDVATPDDAAAVSTALSGMGLSGLNANDVRFLAVGNAGATTVWKWADAGNGGIDSGELTDVADLSGLDTDTLTADNFADFVTV